MAEGSEEPTVLGTNPGLGHVGTYALVDVLGRGGMGAVYLARHTQSGALCALKRPHQERRHSPAIRGRFEREAEIGRVLVHPSVPRLLEADTQSDWPYLVLELVPGLTLEQLTKTLWEQARILPYAVSLTVICHVLEALEAAHELDIVHRDISPRNIMLAFDGTPRLIDFGAAKAELGDFRTTPGSEVGSIRYASPEFVSGAEVGRPADLYAVAAVAYELLAGRPVVPPVDNFLQAVRIIAEETPLPLVSLNPEVPAAVADIVMRGLAKRPANRVESARAFRAALVAAQPQWCELSQEKLQRFLSTWFPREAKALRRLLDATGASGPIEDEGLRTLLAPTMIVRDTMVTPPPDMHAQLMAELGVAFPVVSARPLTPAPRPPRVFGLGAILGTAVASASIAGVAVRASLMPSEMTEVRVEQHAAEATPQARIVAAPATMVPPAPVSPEVPRPSSEPAKLAPAVSREPVPSRRRPAPSPQAERTAAPSPHVERTFARDDRFDLLLARLSKSSFEPLTKDPAFAELIEEGDKAAASLAGENRARVRRAVDAALVGDLPKLRQLVVEVRRARGEAP